MSETATPSPKRAPVKEFFGHVAEMPSWQRKVLVLAGVLAVGGLVGQTISRIARSQAEPAAVNAPEDSRTTGSSAPRSSAFAAGDAPPTAASSTEQPAPPPTFYERISPWASRLGIGFLGGFVIGWAFRAFLKVMALVTLAGIAIIWTLSHFNVLRVDMDAAESRFKSGTSWVSTKAEEWKDSAMALVPSSASSVFGMFLGFRRK
ncbi:MAG: FUN14 domain-containing protein [Tepidisphaeraceae bacterium]